MSDGPIFTRRALNRALLARQGLLAPFAGPPPEVVGRIGLVQAQHWPAVAVALASRCASFRRTDLEAALASGALVFTSLLRGTLHVADARQYPEYAAVTAASGADDWRRTTKEPHAEADALRRRLAAWAADGPRSAAEVTAWIEARLAERPDLLPAAEVERQRALAWRPFRAGGGLLRVAADGRWSKSPTAYRGAPEGTASPPAPEAAFERVVRHHLRAFGPAAVEDVATWTGCRVGPIRAALGRLAPELVRGRDEAGRELHDLADAPRPEPETPAPVRLLPWFDSSLLAYAAKHRGRILPDAHRRAIYNPANLRYEPTFLVDGFVAGSWSVAVKRSLAAITLRPLERIDRATLRELVVAARDLARSCWPEAKAHDATIAH